MHDMSPLALHPHHGVYFSVGLYKESSFLLKREKLTNLLLPLMVSCPSLPARGVAAPSFCLDRTRRISYHCLMDTTTRTVKLILELEQILKHLQSLIEVS